MLSIFDVIEKITFKVLPRPADNSPAPPLPQFGLEGKPTALNSLRMTAVWRRSSDDEANQEYEFKSTVVLPGSSEEHVAGEGRFIFNTLLYRVISMFYSDMPSQSGEIVVTSLIRRIGTEDWDSQRYIIPVERVENADQGQLPLS